MKNYTEEEMNFIKSLTEPVEDLDMNLVNSIIDKMIDNKEYDKLYNFLLDLYDFAKVPEGIVDKLIESNNKECISALLQNERVLYFFTDEEINRLIEFLNALEVNIVLDKPYDYYYKLLLDNDARPHENEIVGDTIEHTFTRYNYFLKFKLIETKDAGVVVSSVFYSNYNLPVEEQVSKIVDYINQFGFNIKKN